MNKNKNKSYSVNKGFYGYVERLQQYATKGENIVINTHSNHFMNFHLHDFYEINYIYKGECDNLFEHGTIHMTEGDFIIISPDAMHSLFVDDTSLVYNFLISKSFLHNLFNKITD